MKLAHTSHKNGRAEILDTDDGEKVVGRSKREPFPLGGYIYEITTVSGERVYKGNAMSSGLAALKWHIERDQATHS